MVQGADSRPSSAPELRRANERLVLRTVRRTEGPTQAEISHLTGLSPGCVSGVVTALAARGLVKRDRCGGRAGHRVLLGERRVAGVDLIDGHHIVVVEDLRGRRSYAATLDDLAQDRLMVGVVVSATADEGACSQAAAHRLRANPGCQVWIQPRLVILALAEQTGLPRSHCSLHVSVTESGHLGAPLIVHGTRVVHMAARWEARMWARNVTAATAVFGLDAIVIRGLGTTAVELAAQVTCLRRAPVGLPPPVVRVVPDEPSSVARAAADCARSLACGEPPPQYARRPR